MRKLTTLLFIFLLNGILLAQNGIELVFHNIEYDKKSDVIKREKYTTIWVTSDMLKISSNNDKDPLLIFSQKMETIQIINRAKHEYFQLSKSDIKVITDQLAKSQELMKQSLANLPEDQQEEFKKQFYSNTERDSQEAIDYKDTEIEDSIGPYYANLYEGWIQHEKFEDIYIADFDQFTFTKKHFDTYFGLMDFIRENMKPLLNVFPESPANILKSVEHPSFKKGMPIKTVNYSKGIMTNSEVLESSKFIEIPIEAFSIPPGFKMNDIMSEMMSNK